MQKQNDNGVWGVRCSSFVGSSSLVHF